MCNKEERDSHEKGYKTKEIGSDSKDARCCEPESKNGSVGERRIGMYEVKSIKDTNHEAWLKLRKTGIGGSDAAAICGLNPYASAVHVFQEKTSEELNVKDNEPMRQGRGLEDYVARRFCEASGLKVRRSHMLYRSTSHSFMIADVDRLIVGQDAGLECKAASAYSYAQWKDGQIPPITLSSAFTIWQ